MSIRSAANSDLTLKNVNITQDLKVQGDTELQGSLSCLFNNLNFDCDFQHLHDF